MSSQFLAAVQNAVQVAVEEAVFPNGFENQMQVEPHVFHVRDAALGCL